MRKITARQPVNLVALVALAFLLLVAGCSAPAAPVKEIPALAPAPAPPSAAPTAPPPPPPVPAPSAGKEATLNLVARGMAFDTKVITVPAGAAVTVNFENRDTIGHNLAVYTDKSAATSIFKGDVISSKSVVYKFTAPSAPGTYFFRCDPHPTTMTGDFIVTP